MVQRRVKECLQRSTEQSSSLCFYDYLMPIGRMRIFASEQGLTSVSLVTNKFTIGNSAQIGKLDDSLQCVVSDEGESQKQRSIIEQKRVNDQLCETMLEDEVVGRKMETPLIREAAEQLREYFEGRRMMFELPLALVGTSFQRRVWEALRRIPYGSCRTYGEVAREVGVAGAARAVGLACNRNPWIIIVPCHRVVGAGGKLTGYAHGLECKRALLELEHSHLNPDGLLF